MGIMQTESKFISIFFSLQAYPNLLGKKGYVVVVVVSFLFNSTYALKNQNNNYT